MKALRKKYGKRRWEDTPNAAWWRRERAQRRFLAHAMCGSVAAIAYNNISAIRSTPGDPEERRKAIERVTEQTRLAMQKTFDNYGKPPAKNRSTENETNGY